MLAANHNAGHVHEIDQSNASGQTHWARNGPVPCRAPGRKRSIRMAVTRTRARIIAQPFFGLHLVSRAQMLGFAIAIGDIREAAGQIFRLALVPLGTLTGHLPIGNMGRARISAFRPMPVPPDLAELISSHDKQDLP